MWLIFGLLAGNAIAGERADRSAEFVAYLPIQRWRTLASKQFLALMILTAFLSFQILFALVFLRQPGLGALYKPWPMVGFVSTFFAAYGISWLFAVAQSSAVIAGSMGLAFNTLVLGSATALAYANLEQAVGFVSEDYVYKAMAEPIFVWMTIFSLPVAIVCLGIGSWIFLLRREP